MKITITLKYPKCSGTNIKNNGIKYNNKQSYFCNYCKRQFMLPVFSGNIGAKRWTATFIKVLTDKL